MPPDRRAFTALKRYGLLLLKDPALPNLCRLVAGARVRGSWWAHQRAQKIFKVYDALENHPDVLLLKLISRKVTYVHRPLWPQVVAIGRARELWQTTNLSTAARKLLAEVDKVPVEPGRDKAAAAKELDARMLVFIAQFHSESGAQVLRLESWDHWSNRTHFCPHSTTPASARKALEERIVNLNREFAGRAGCHGKASWNSRDVPLYALPVNFLGGYLTFNHVHFQVRDLSTAVDWFASILELKPGFQDERIATFIFGAMTMIIDAAPADSPATIGFESDDCDRDFEMVVSRGAVSIEPPANKEWGVRTAYFKGPGAIKCEIEGPVVKEPQRRV